MAVEVDNGYRSVFPVDGTEERECDGVVTSESDQTRKRCAFL